MKILYIWDADYPWDIRVEKICMTLLEHGHEVHIAARNLKRQQMNEIVGGLYIHRLRPWKYKKINYMASFPAFFSPVWKVFLERIIKTNGIELIIVRDLPMAIAGIRRGKKYRIPVIFDMAEDYVSLIRGIWRGSKFKGLNILVRNPYLAKLVESYTFKHINHTLVVVEEAVDVVKSGGGNIEKVTIVANTPDLSAIANTQKDNDNKVLLDNRRYTAIYTGGIQLGRGMQIVFDAIPDIIKVIPDFLFVVIGDGYATEQLKILIEKMKLQENVQWVGWVNHENIFEYIRQSDIGVIPHYTSDHVNTTIPNKIFDYMACGLPVLASDAKPMKRIIEKMNCGLLFESGNAKDFTEKVIQMYQSDVDYGGNGRRAVENEYNWSIDEARLLDTINVYGMSI